MSRYAFLAEMYRLIGMALDDKWGVEQLAKFKRSADAKYDQKQLNHVSDLVSLYMSIAKK